MSVGDYTSINDYQIATKAGSCTNREMSRIAKCADNRKHHNQELLLHYLDVRPISADARYFRFRLSGIISRLRTGCSREYLQSQRDGTDTVCITHVEKMNARKVLMGKPEGKSPL
jgi:hypothetical protein